MTIRFSSFLMFLALFSAAPSSAAEPTPVRFAKGASSASLSGKVKGYAMANYSVAARKDQTMTVRLNSKNRFLYFNVVAPDGETLFIGAEQAAPSPFILRLPVSGTYRISAYLMRNEARRGVVAPYTLTVAIK